MNFSKTPSSTQPACAITIHASEFQPFASRVGVDTVVKLLPYNAELVQQLKRLLDSYKTQAVDPALGRLNAGGWLPQCGCWFCEPVIWDSLRLELTFLGYGIREGRP